MYSLHENINDQLNASMYLFYLLLRCNKQNLMCVCVCVAPQVKYMSNPAVMARVISTCLKEERRILSSACTQEQVCHTVSLSGKVPLVP